MIAFAVNLDLQLCGTVTGLQLSFPQYSCDPFAALINFQPDFLSIFLTSFSYPFMLLQYDL